MPRELIARGQATIYTQQDSYTITQSLAEYIFEATNDGVIPRDVVFASTVSVTLGGSAVSDFAIGAIVKPAGFASITVDPARKTITYRVNKGTATLADSGSIEIPVTVGAAGYRLSFVWSKARAGAPGKDSEVLLPDWVNEWDSGKTQIDGSSVITPKLFAGVRNADNTTTGVAIGHYTLLARNDAGQYQRQTVDGVYAFHEGRRTFALDTTGSVQLGRGEESIRYDASTGKILFGAQVAMQWAGATYIDANGLFTGTLSAESVRAATIDASQIASGVIDTARLNTKELQAQILTAQNIESLTLDVVRGTIGGWTIDSDAIFRGTKSNAPDSYTAGPGAVTLSSNGLRGYRWRLEASGAGALAGGNILWDASGKVTFSEGVSLQWTAPLAALTKTLEEEVSPRLTHISSEGIYTGTLSAQQVNAVALDAGSIRTGTLSADRLAAGSITAEKLDAASIRADIVTADYISGLGCSFHYGKIGGWKITFTSLYNTGMTISSSDRSIRIFPKDGLLVHYVKLYHKSETDFGFQATDASGKTVAQLGTTNCIAGWMIEPSRIYKNNVSLGADGSIANTTKWKLGNDGSGSLAAGNIIWDTYGNVTFGASVCVNWTSAANAALASAKTYADTKKSEAIGAASADATQKAEAAKVLARAMAFGKMLYRVPEFFLDGSVHYNGTANYPAGATRSIEKVAGCPNSTGYALKYTATGWNSATDKRIGGFSFGTPSRANAVFVVRIIAQIPVGRALQNYHNNYGDGGSTTWLTSNAGTGKWEEYICKVVCGATGTFSTLNHFALTGGAAPTSAAPAVWRAAYATVFDVTASEKYTTTLDAEGIYTGTLSAQQVNAVSIDAGSIKAGTLSADRIAAGSIRAEKLDAASIKTSIINTSYIEGLTLTFQRGKIGGWTIGADSITAGSVGTVGAMPIQIRSAASGSGYWCSGAYKPYGITMTWHQSGNAGHFVFGQIAASGNSVKTGFIGLQMMSWDYLEYFCLAANYTKSGGKETYNRIAGWAFDHARIYKNNVSLGADGSITGGSKWKLNNDGSGSLASGNISWNAAGAVTFGSSVSLQWKNDIEASKSTNYGYRYYKKIIINGESSKYYPVVFKGGDQTVKRDIMIRRGFNEQAPSDWASSSTHMGGLNLLIKTNFGGWGGAGYSWDIYDLEEVYCRTFGGAAICGNYCMFAVFLRGGGTTGAAYHLYSDQPIESSSQSPSPIPPAPQIAYNSEVIFQSGSTQAKAPAPRTLTAAVEEEIRRHRFIALAQGNDTTLKDHPLTYIGATGIYTGTVKASQVVVDSTLVVGGSAHAGSISVRDAGNAVKVTLDRTGITAVGGKIGGWNLTSSSLYAGSVYLNSAGNIYNGSYWRLSSDGSGFLAKNNISWTAAGVLTMKGATIQDAVIKGTLRSPFVMVDGSIWVDVDSGSSSSTNKPDADKYDNICVQAGTDSGGWNLQQPELPWDVSQSGRRLCLTHYRYGSQYVYGTCTFTAPSGKYFYENGRLASKLNMSRQVVELIGFGTSSTFHGWIVLNRRDLGTTSKYGDYLQYLAMGSVTLNSGYGITLKQKTYDGTKVSVSRTGTGIFHVYLPWSLGVDKYMVILSGKMSPVFNTSIYATVRYQYDSYFVVHTQDDASQNDGSFNFLVVSTADFV